HLAISADSSWNQWHPTYEELGQRCRSLGVDHLELVYYPENEGFGDVAETLATFGVSIVCVNATATHRINVLDDPRVAIDHLVDCVDLAAELEAEYVVMYAGHNHRWNLKENVELFRRRM